MATIRKPGGSWQAQIRRKGQTLSKTFLLKADAVRWANLAEQEADRKGLPTDPRTLERMTVADLLKRYCLPDLPEFLSRFGPVGAYPDDPRHISPRPPNALRILLRESEYNTLLDRLGDSKMLSIRPLALFAFLISTPALAEDLFPISVNESGLVLVDKDSLVDQGNIRRIPADPKMLERMTVADLLKRYSETVLPLKRAGTNEAIILKAFVRSRIAGQRLSDINANQFAAYRDERLCSRM
jgi:hypothetical protein